MSKKIDDYLDLKVELDDNSNIVVEMKISLKEQRIFDKTYYFLHKKEIESELKHMIKCRLMELITQDIEINGIQEATLANKPLKCKLANIIGYKLLMVIDGEQLEKMHDLIYFYNKKKGGQPNE